jgi:hypothetical protein
LTLGGDPDVPLEVAEGVAPLPGVVAAPGVVVVLGVVVVVAELGVVTVVDEASRDGAGGGVTAPAVLAGVDTLGVALAGEVVPVLDEVGLGVAESSASGVGNGCKGVVTLVPLGDGGGVGDAESGWTGGVGVGEGVVSVVVEG